MITWNKFIQEKRKNPELNPKVSAYQYLKQYKDRDDIYISFTDLLKIGIKPMSTFNTPNGIYTYPLKEFWKRYRVEQSKEVGGVAPFAGERKYIAIIKAKHSKGFVQDMYKDYTSKNYDRDIEKLKKLFGVQNNSSRVFIKEALTFLKKRLPKFFDKDVAKIVLEEIKEIRFSILCDDFIDETRSIIKWKDGNKDKSEKELKKLLKELKELPTYFDGNDTLTSIIDDASWASTHKSPIGMFWYITMMLSRIKLSDKLLGNHSNTQKWNNLLRKLGYTGFGDKSGKGLIHDAEPLQALFLTKNEITVIDQIPNKDYKGRISLKFVDNTENENKSLKDLENELFN